MRRPGPPAACGRCLGDSEENALHIYIYIYIISIYLSLSLSIYIYIYVYVYKHYTYIIKHIYKYTVKGPDSQKTKTYKYD